MIFKNKIIRLPDGDNLSLHIDSENELTLYLTDGVIKKKLLKLDKIFRCKSVPVQYDCDCVIQISDKHLCLCSDGNIAVVEI